MLRSLARLAVGVAVGVTVASGCGADPPAFPEAESSLGGTVGSTTVTSADDGGDTEAAGSTSGSTTDGTSSTGSADDTTASPPVEVTLDILVIVDDTAGMGGPQLRLATALASWVATLRENVDALDAQLMVTTTDMGHPTCSLWPNGSEPAQGAPIGIPCTEHLEDFTTLAGNDDLSAACTVACPVPTFVDGTFLRFSKESANVSEGSLEDALRCLVPQGVVGCGWEAPLEAMHAALSTEACWNLESGCDTLQEEPPFLRPGADLLVIVLTNELDCSLANPAIVTNQMFQNVNPDTGNPAPSSAVCFNAGVTCDGPDGRGSFSNCMATDDGNLHSLFRYTGRLIDELIAEGKNVTFMPIVGFSLEGPAATEVRQWADAQYPAGDIVPPEWAAGVRAEDKNYQFGIGPGCTASAQVGEWVQGLPPIRLREICDAVDTEDRGRCCPTSVCDDALEQALQCATDHVVGG